MELIKITKQCIQNAVGLFKGQMNEESLSSHKSLYDLHKQNYEEAFYLIENKINILRIKLNDKKYNYILTYGKQQFSIFCYENHYICNCDKFNSKEFIICPHILASLIAEELQICECQNEIKFQDYLQYIKTF